MEGQYSEKEDAGEKGSIGVNFVQYVLHTMSEREKLER